MKHISIKILFSILGLLMSGLGQIAYCHNNLDKNKLQEYYNMGSTLADQEKYLDAIYFLNEAKNVAEQDNDIKLLANIYSELGIIYYKQDVPKRAISYFEEMLKFNTILKDTLLIARAYDMIGGCYLEIGKADSALTNFHKALELKTLINAEEAIITSKSNISGCYLDMGLYQKTIDYLLEVEEDCERTGYTTYLAVFRLNLANAYQKADNIERAIHYYNKVVEMNKQLTESNSNESFQYTKMAYEKLAKLYKSQEQYEESIKIQELIDTLNDSIAAAAKDTSRTYVEKYHLEKKKNQEERTSLYNYIRVKKQYSYIIIIGVILIICFITISALVYRLYLISKRNNAKLEEKVQVRTQELAVARKKAEEANNLKSKFLANMTHEIRTPLSAIVGFSDIICSSYKNEESPEDIEEYNHIIKSNSELLERLINDILELSKIEASGIVLEPVEFDFNELLNDTYLYATSRKKTEIELTLNKPSEECKVVLDRNRCQQIISNFISNALKYTQKGSITIGSEMKDNGIYFYVEDTGIGISAGDKKRLFQRFEKLDNYAPGTGLGLSIAKAIVDAMSGKIGVESEIGKGSRFWVWLPINPNSIS